MKWNSNLYNDKHDFVAEYGKGLLEFIPKNENQSILDLGCGTGTLTSQLVPFASRVVGIDSSSSMIDTAKKQYENIEFLVGDALNLPFEREFDVVFSNAVFHWIVDHNKLLQSVHKVLKSNGILICEFGGEGNIASIEDAFLQACYEHQIVYKPKFNFPSANTFANCLSANGFVSDLVYDYDRPTVLKDGARGLENWMRQFFASEFTVMSKDTQVAIIKQVEEKTKGKLWNGKEWVADYRRLRVIAHI